MKKRNGSLVLKLLFIIMLGMMVFVLSGCGGSNASLEHDPEERFIYFTAIEGDNPIDIKMEKGSGELKVAMDNGELRIKLTGAEGQVILDTDANFSADYTVDIPESGTYTLHLLGKKASGSVNY